MCQRGIFNSPDSHDLNKVVVDDLRAPIRCLWPKSHLLIISSCEFSLVCKYISSKSDSSKPHSSSLFTVRFLAMLDSQNIHTLNILLTRYHNTYLNWLFTCNISLTLSCLVYFSSGFLLTVTMQIGSLAHLTCFWSVFLSCIFWSISNPFFKNNVFSFLLCFVSSRWNFFQEPFFAGQVSQLTKGVEHQESHF